MVCGHVQGKVTKIIQLPKQTEALNAILMNLA